MRPDHVTELLETSIEQIHSGKTVAALSTLGKALTRLEDDLNSAKASLVSEPDENAKSAALVKIQQDFSEGRLEDAALYANLALLQFPGDPLLLELEALVNDRIQNSAQRDHLISEAERQSENQDWELAIQNYEAARRLDPESAPINQRMAHALVLWSRDLARKDRAAALKLLETSLSLDDNSEARKLQQEILNSLDQEALEAVVSEVRKLQSQGNYTDAEARLEEAQTRWPGNNLLVSCHAAIRQEHEAKKKDAETEAEIRALLAVRQFVEAENIAREALARQPESETFRTLLRDIQEETTQHKAERALSQIIALDTLGTVPALKKALDVAEGGLQNAKENASLSKARVRVEKRLKERDSELQTLIAQIEQNLTENQLADAKLALKRALELDPENPKLNEFNAALRKVRRQNLWSWIATEKTVAQGSRADPDEPVETGEVLAQRYKILSLLGSGGMSTVYKAQDLLAGQTMAVKVVQPAISRDARLREKFKKELHVARRLAHPNIVRIYDISEHRGLLFITMELIEGQTVNRLLAEKRRLNLEEFLDLFRQFTTALAYIHSQKILHRDIKPQNLMYDRNGILKVMDFGIARDLAAASDQTTSHIPMGTPAYMSPELLEGGTLTPSSDLYSAGTMFYELLTGAKPFSNASLYERANKPVPRVSEVVKDIPRDVDEAIYRSMQVQVERRFQTVEELIAAISPRTHASAAAPQGTLAGLLRDDPPAVEAALLLLLRIANKVAEIHASGPNRPILSPQSIRVAENQVDIETMAAGETRQHTRVVNCKYASADDFQEGAGRGPVSDVYVMGFIFYEVLAGQRRFREQFSDCYGADAELQWLNWHSDPSRVAIPLKNLGEKSPAAVSDLIAQMMNKSAERRPQLSEVQTALTAIRQEFSRNAGKTLILKAAATTDMKPRPGAKPRTFPFWTILFVLLAVLTIAGVIAWRSGAIPLL